VPLQFRRFVRARQIALAFSLAPQYDAQTSEEQTCLLLQRRRPDECSVDPSPTTLNPGRALQRLGGSLVAKKKKAAAKKKPAKKAAKKKK
jgi:hypothetical protein